MVLSAAAALWFYIEPVHSWAITSFGDIAALGAFTISCGFIIGAIAAMHRAHANAPAHSPASDQGPYRSSS